MRGIVVFEVLLPLHISKTNPSITLQFEISPITGRAAVVSVSQGYG